MEALTQRRGNRPVPEQGASLATRTLAADRQRVSKILMPDTTTRLYMNSSVLLDVPSERQPAFFSAAQARYAQVAGHHSQDSA